jgi:hypothetical protein
MSSDPNQEELSPVRVNNLIQDRASSKFGAIAGGTFLIACCIAGPLLIGAACVLALGAAVELAAVAAVLAIWAVVLWRRKAARRTNTNVAA